MSVASNLNLFPSTKFGRIERQSKLNAMLITVGIACIAWITDSLFDAFVFHDNTFIEELFSPSSRELPMRFVMIFVAAMFTYFYLRLKQTGSQVQVFFELVENAADCVLLRTLEGQILYSNSATSQKLGYSREELLTMNLKDIDPSIEEAALKASLEIFRQKKIFRGEREHRTKSGQFIPVEFLGSYLKINGREYVLSVIRDISERKIIEQELQRSQKNLNEAQRIAQIGSYVWNLKTAAVEFSDEIYRLYGRKVGDPDFTLEKSLDVVHPEDKARLQETIDEDTRTKRPHTSEHRIIWPNGVERWVHCQGEFVLDNAGNPICMLGTIHDVTKGKKAEQELQKTAVQLRDANKLKDLFTDVLSHDLLNPAAAVKVASQLLLRIETDPTKIKIINSICKSTENLIDLCSNASKYAKVASSDQLEFSRHDLSTLLTSAIRDLEHLSTEKRIQIHFDPNKVCFARINLMIKDVFLNLISNAIKYSPSGSIVSVDIHDEGNAWGISISDQGEGIPDKYKNKIFSRFERIGVIGVKGTGLGLAIAKGIVDLHRGKIWVEDNADKGSVFRIKLWKNLAL